MMEVSQQSSRAKTRLISVWICAVVLVACTSALAAAPNTAIAQQQSPAAPPQTAKPPAGAPPVATLPGMPQAPAPPTYSYNPEGRRDPFVSLVARGMADGRPPGKRAAGLAGLTAGELTLKGILQSRGEYLALVQGPDAKTYTAHSNDRLFDGRIKSITADAVVILQEVNDPLSLTKQREIRKTLRGLEDTK